MSRCRGLMAISAVLHFAVAVGAQLAPVVNPRVDPFGDPLPRGALFRIGTTRLQLDREIQAVAVSADGKRIAAVSDALLGVWEIPGGREIDRRRLDPFVRTPAAPLVALSPDGQSVLVNSMQALRLMDAASGKEQRSLGEEAVDAVFAADGQTLTVVQLQSMVVRRFDLTGDRATKEWVFQPEPTLQEGTVANSAVIFRLAGDGRLLATLESNRASRKQLLRIHEAATGNEVRRWPVDAPPLRRVVFSSDGRLVAGASSIASDEFEPTVCVWETMTGKEVARWHLPGGISTGRPALVFAPDGTSVFSTDASGVVCWDWRSAKRVRDYPDAGGPLAFRDGGKTLVAQGPLGAIRLLDVATGKDLHSLPRMGREVAMAPDGRHVAWPDRGAVVLTEVPTGRERRRWPAHDRFVGPLAFAPDGRLLASAGTDLRIVLWEVPDGRAVRTLFRTGVNGLFFARDGRHLVTSGAADVCLWDVATGKRTGWWYGKGEAPIMAPGLEALAIPDRPAHRLRVVEPISGKELHTLAGYYPVLAYAVPHLVAGVDDMPVAIAPRFSPNGRLLMAGTERAKDAEFDDVQFWDVTAGQRLPAVLRGQDIALSHMAFAPDSRQLAVMRADRRLCLVSPTTGETVRLLGVGAGSLTTMPAFTPDGRTLITATSAGLHPSLHVVQIWEIASGGEIVRWTGHLDVVRSLHVSADGCRLVSTSADHTALVWDLANLTDGKRPPADTLWAELAQNDAVRGRRAIEALLAAPAATMALFRQHLRPAVVPDVKKVAQWIEELESDDFAQRQRAEMELDRLSDPVGPALHKALAAKPPLETRRRIETLLKKLHSPTLTSEQIRAVRAVQVLEGLATPDALRMLEAISRGDPTARLTAEANAALARRPK